MFSLVPKDDPKQAVRVRRFFMALGSYLVWVGIVVYCKLQGFFLLPDRFIPLFVGPLLLGLVGIYLALRTGASKRFADPSLTVLQIFFATIVIMVTIYFTDQARGVMLLVYLVTFVFGIFRLTVMQFLGLTALALAGYGVVIAALFAFRPESINLRLELLQLAVLGLVLPWFSMVGGYLSGLRHRLAHSNAELSQALTTISELAVTDQLTGVYNRRRMVEVLEKEKALADRGGPAFAICLFDLDHFKKVNDTLGHLHGDMVLRAFGQGLLGTLRTQDTLARYGGEEFVLVLPQTDEQGALACAERVRLLARELRFPEFPPGFCVTVSAGVAVYGPGEEIENLLARVDAAAYEAKQKGRDQVACSGGPAGE